MLKRADNVSTCSDFTDSNHRLLPSIVGVVLLGLWFASTEPDSRNPNELSAAPNRLLIKR